MTLADKIKQFNNSPERIATDIRLALATHIEYFLNIKGMTIEKLAKKLGVYPGYITWIIAGKSNMSISQIAKILYALDEQTTVSTTTNRNCASTNISTQTKQDQIAINQTEKSNG